MIGAKISRTQWAAQFLVAAELVRLGYVVSFTMGNTTPMADLMVGRQNGTQFWVDVKGVTDHRAILQREKEKLEGLFYVVVNVGTTRDNDEFYVLSQSDFNALIRGYFDTHPNDRKVPGFTFKHLKEPISFRDNWKILLQ
jgi:hypothetical protein